MWFTEAGKFVIGMYYIYFTIYICYLNKYMLCILYYYNIYLDQQLYYSLESLNIFNGPRRVHPETREKNNRIPVL